MKIAVFGATNALGMRMCELADAQGHAVTPASRRVVAYTDIDSVYKFLKATAPDMVINSASAAITTSTLPDLVLINSFFPHILKEITLDLNIKVVHVSSDSVFSGHNTYRSTINTPTDPTGYYGKSRVLGEVAAPNVSIIRTSFVGNTSSVVRWLRAQEPGTLVDGWINYKWTGSTLEAVALSIIKHIKYFEPGLHHLATKDPITKLDLVQLLVKRLGLDLKVKTVYQPCVNRALTPSAPEYVLKPLAEALADDQSFDSDPTDVQEEGA